MNSEIRTAADRLDRIFIASRFQQTFSNTSTGPRQREGAGSRNVSDRDDAVDLTADFLQR
jgi:hypothetical protein